ncbi:MAG: DNA replication and repair protein RecF [Chloroflexota bacterium]|nr:DNA replication and repair protein RecF [Chloroflexota bacterium]
MARLSRLILSNFRNFAALDLDVPSGVVVFYGANAQGKTTLLEAVYLLAIARSFRAENEREVVSFSAAASGDQALVGGILDKAGERVQIYAGYSCTAPSAAVPGPDAVGPGLNYSVRKEIRVNRIRRTAADLVGTVGAVLFNAEDIDLVQGPPSGRRRYLDILISQANPLYLKALQRYTRIVRQRNRLLRLLREGRAENSELQFWDDRLVTEGAWLSWQRASALTLLGDLCSDHHQTLTSPGELLSLEHLPSVPVGDGVEATADHFRGALADRRSRDLAAGSTSLGPHRDDFKLLVDGVDMGTFASRGQARTLALALRLAEASYLLQVRQDEPVVLLDDVLSEMDEDRRTRVLEKVVGYGQSLITTTDLDLVRGYFGNQATYFRVGDGAVTPLQTS